MFMNKPLKKRILVVDDEEDIVVSIANILQRANYEVKYTLSGQQSVQLAATFKPDLIILDIVMPDLGGGEIAAMLLENPVTSRIPIIFLTGLLKRNEEENIINVDGKHAVVAKPVSSEELVRLVSETLYKPFPG